MEHRGRDALLLHLISDDRAALQDGESPPEHDAGSLELKRREVRERTARNADDVDVFAARLVVATSHPPQPSSLACRPHAERRVAVAGRFAILRALRRLRRAREDGGERHSAIATANATERGLRRGEAPRGEQVVIVALRRGERAERSHRTRRMATERGGEQVVVIATPRREGRADRPHRSRREVKSRAVVIELQITCSNFKKKDLQKVRKEPTILVN